MDRNKVLLKREKLREKNHRILRLSLSEGVIKFLDEKSIPHAIELDDNADYAIQRHYPELIGSENIYLGFLSKVINKQAFLISQWIFVCFMFIQSGFIYDGLCHQHIFSI
jgi:hypothetical protein